MEVTTAYAADWPYTKWGDFYFNDTTVVRRVISIMVIPIKVRGRMFIEIVCPLIQSLVGTGIPFIEG